MRDGLPRTRPGFKTRVHKQSVEPPIVGLRPASTTADSF